MPEPQGNRTRSLRKLIAATLMAVAPISVWAQVAPQGDTSAAEVAPSRTEPLPDAFEGVGIDEKLEQQLPLDLEFTDSEGRQVRLGDYFGQGRPVILTLNYYRCPQLCGLQLNAMVDILKELDWSPGEEFEVVTISFDPLETAQLAKLKKQSYLEYYGRPAAGSAWHFLVGNQEPVNRILDATGYRVRWNEKRREWAHAAALVLCTPDGRISRYIYGLTYAPKTLRLSLVEASEGKIGSPMDQVLLFCFHYDPEEGTYAASAFNLMRAGAVLTMVIVGTFLWILWRRDRRRTAVVVESSPA